MLPADTALALATGLGVVFAPYYVFVVEEYPVDSIVEEPRSMLVLVPFGFLLVLFTGTAVYGLLGIGILTPFVVWLFLTGTKTYARFFEGGTPGDSIAGVVMAIAPVMIFVVVVGAIEYGIRSAFGIYPPGSLC